MQVVSTGLADVLLPVDSGETLAAAIQDEAEVKRLSEELDVVGVHMFCRTPGTQAVALCRNFAPRYAIPEEAATGTSNGALTYYLYRLGLVEAGAESRFFQGESMGNPRRSGPGCWRPRRAPRYWWAGRRCCPCGVNCCDDAE